MSVSIFKIILIFLQFVFILSSCDNHFNDENTLLNSARTAYLTDNNLKADEIYKKYLTKYPFGKYRIEAWERIYDISTYLRRTSEDSLLILDSMLLEFKDNKKLYKDYLSRSIDLNINLNRYDKAIEHLNTLLNYPNITSKDRILAHLQISKMLSNENNNEQALNIIQDCFSESVSLDIYCSCSFYNVHILIIQNKFETAKVFLNNILKQCSFDKFYFNHGNFILGEIYENLDDKLQALHAYEKILGSHPNSLLIKTKIKHLDIK